MTCSASTTSSAPSPTGRPRAFDGPAEQWVDTLSELAVDGGMDSFAFGWAGDALARVQRLIDDVVPAVIDRVQQERDSR